ncbi:transposase [Streptomyces mirabilis]|uniref:transposase n=1 Tax=Streptomyces mirabilis TaxID=68239 RepID=UPI002E1C0D0F|nr:transposase [Streptomyces mirabilis]
MAGHACHLPPWDRVYAFFLRWRNHDLVREFHDRLRRLVRERAGRDSEPGAGVIDSQSVKADAVVGSDSRGFDGGKLINGRKRHVVVDTLGLLLAVMVTAADVGDRAAAQVLLTQVTAAHHPSTQRRAVSSRCSSSPTTDGILDLHQSNDTSPLPRDRRPYA